MTGADPTDKRTFFVSYTGKDEDWATWIAETIETIDGWRAIVQAWDFVASKNFGREMHQAAQADHTVPVFTPAYFQSEFAEAEWLAAWVSDPKGQDARVIPVVVEDCWPKGLLRPIIHINLVGLQDEARARATLLEELRAAILGTRQRRALRFPGGTVAAGSCPDRPAGPRHRCIYGVGQPTATFVGRTAELQELVRLLAAGDVAMSASIEGLAGVGKTELATMLVYELADQGCFAGGIYWLNAESPDLAAEWARVAAGMGLCGSVEDLTQAMLSRIAEAEDDVLIVLDNVESWSVNSEPSPLPSSPAKILVTSRQRGVGGNRFQHFTLGVLSRDEARTLLEVLVGPHIINARGFDALLDRLDGHTLAVELAGVFLADMTGEVTPQEYVERIESGGHPTEDVSAQTRYGRTVEGALRLLFDRAAPELRHAWMVFGQLEPEAASDTLLDACGITQEDRRLLRRWHLIDPTDRGFRMHRLVGGFARAVAATEGQETVEAEWADGLLRRADDVDLATGFQVYLPDRMHFDAILRQRPRSLTESDWSRLLDRVGTAQQSAGMLSAARATLEQALASDLENFGEGHPSVATSRSNLAGVLQDLGDLEGAKRLLEQALASALENFGEGHPSVATSRSNLALVLYDCGEIEQAARLETAVLEWTECSLGATHPAVAHRAANLMFTLRAMGNADKAREMALKALAIARDLPPGSQTREYVETCCGWAEA